MKTAAFPPKAGSRLLVTLMVIGATWLTATAQNPQVTVRFANPSYSCETDAYCVDVEFSTDTPGEQLFGMNVRFFFEDTLMNLIGFTNFASGYGPVSPDPPQEIVGMQAGMDFFQFSGSAVFVNGAIQLIDPLATPILLDTSFTQLFTICFDVVDSTANINNFCPPLVWDLEVDPANGGYLIGDDGVVITLVDPDPAVDSKPSDEMVDQFNWMYSGDGTPPYGEVIEEVCMSINCAPMITCAADLTIECDDDTSPLVTGSASAEDICDGDTTITFSDVEISGSCPNLYTIQRTWIATNPCGLADTCIQTITVVDTTAPVIITCAGPLTVSCANLVPAPTPAQVTATDNCPGLITYSFVSDSIANQTCINRYIIHRRYAATDACGNSSTCTQIITVNDITVPVITCPGPVTVSCISQIPAINVASVIATDNCGGTVTVTWVSDNITNTTCMHRFTLTRVYRATDACGNSATCSQIITVNDQIPPTLTCPAPITVSCQNLVPAPNPALVLRSDNCSGTVTVVFVNDVITNQTCQNRYTITRTYRGTDVCGNQSTCSQTITVNDITAPTITCPANTTVECTASTLPPATGEPTVTDVCVGTTSYTYLDSFTPGACPGSYLITRVFTGLDACMNSATCTQLITVVDTTPPVLTCPPAVTVECTDDTSVTALGDVLADDACDTLVTTSNFENIVPGSCPGNYIIMRNFVGADQCGNADTCTQIITVVDTTPPVLTCPLDVTIECDDDMSVDSLGTATGTDACDTTVTFFSFDVIANGACAGSFTISRSFIGVDGCGNADTCVQTITVQDITPPVITCPVDVTVECTDDTSVDSLGNATATDNCDTLVLITVSNEIVDGSCPGNYTIERSFIGTDDCGNADTCVQIITVEDTTPPVLTCPPAVTVSCEDDMSVDSLGIATGIDACDTAVTITSFDETIPGSCPGSYSITRSFIGTDGCGNTDTCTQTIVVFDLTPPEIVCPDDVTVECTDDTSVDSLGLATATDNCDTLVDVTSSDVTISGICVGTFTIERTFIGTDDCGNTDTCVQIITVVDSTPPVITCPDNITIECDADTDPDNTGSAEGTDACDTLVTFTFFDEIIDGSCPSNYTIQRSFVGEDGCGNADTCVQTITVGDFTAPLIICPDNLLVDCSSSTSPDEIGVAVATDNCSDSTDLIIDYFDFIPASCETGFVGAYDTANWTIVVESSQNGYVDVMSDQQVMLVSADSSSCLGDGSFVLYQITVPTDAFINFDWNFITVDIDGPALDPFGYMLNGNFQQLTDNGGANAQSGNQTVLVQAGDVFAFAQFSTDCILGTGATTVVEFQTCDEQASVADSCTYVLYRQWSAEDECGNVSYCLQEITVTDTVAPVITCPDDVTVDCTASLSPDSLGVATAEDDCDTLVTIDFFDVIETGECQGNYTITRNFVGTDNCGNADTCFQIINVQDTLGPVLVCPPDASFSCSSDVPEPDSTLVQATDNCSDTVLVNHLEDNFEFICSNRYILARTYVGTDDCGNTSVCTQYFNVQDTIPPTITCPVDTTVSCTAEIPPVDTSLVVITDNCASGLVAVLDTTYTDNIVCANQYHVVRVYSVNDGCGNIATCQQIITVLDTIPPVLDCPADITVDSLPEIDPENTGFPEVTDNCAGEVEVEYTDVEIPGSCESNVIIERTWIATDSCGNVDSCVQNILVLGECSVDLALSKALGMNPDTLRPGDDVEFSILVENQGNVVISEVTIVDYIPVGLTLNDPDWTAGTDGSTGQSASIVLNEGNGGIPVGGLLPGADISVTITLQINPDATFGVYENLAEIAAVLDFAGDDVSDFDVDSDPDNDDTNDPMGEDDIDAAAFCIFVAPGLDGDYRICSGETATYTVTPSFPDHTYTFEFSEPVTIVDMGPDYVTIEWTQDPGTMIDITVIDQQGECIATDTFTVGILSAEPLVCIGHVNLSLDNECGTMVMPDNVLFLDIPGDELYQVYVIDMNGDTVPDAKMTFEHVGQTFKVSVVNDCTGQSCWSWMTVEDKLPPRLECVCPVDNEDAECRVTCLLIDEFLQGNIPEEYRPRAIDACSGTELVLTNVELDYETCETGFISVSWQATDHVGNVATCEQEIYIDPLTLETLVPPADFIGDCTTSDDPDTTGWPQLLGLDITDVPSYCNIIATYRDDVIPVCGAGRKIFRRWKVLDWCNLEEREFTQVITLKDLEGPVVAPIGTIEYPASAHECSVDAIIPRPLATDVCSSVDTYTLFSPFGVIEQVGGQYIIRDLPVGTHTLHWNISDICHNVTTVYFDVTVRDIAPPAMACQLHTNVALTSHRPGGITTVMAASFDAGSADNCSDVTLRVRRMDSCIDVDWTTEGGCADDAPDGFVTGHDDGTEWGDCVPFSCCDLGGPPVMIQVEATDESGNVNYCMVEVEVQDKLRPEIVCPPMVVISCEYLTDLQTGTFTDVNGDGSLDEDPLSAVFGNVYSSFIHADSVRKPVVINDPANTDYPQPNVWGIDGMAYDNCSGTLSVTVSETIDCSGETLPAGAPENAVKVISRVFIVNDGFHSASCMQRIWVVDNTPFYISDSSCENEDPNDGVIWPCDATINECAGDMVEAGRPIIIEDGCSQIGVTHTDERFDFAEGACYKILRTWHIIDWCQFGGKGQGQWTYTQEIKVADIDGADFVSCPGEVLELCTNSPGVRLPANNQVFLGENDPDASSCGVHVTLNQTVRETCSSTVRYDVKLFLFGGLDSVILKPSTLLELDENHEGVMSFNTELISDPDIVLNGLPYTSSDCSEYHFVRWTVEDGCGNRSYCEYDLRLSDCKAPTPVCLNGVSTVVMPVEGEVEVSASTFNASSVDDCTPAVELVYSFTENTYTPTFTYTCENVPEFGEEIPVSIWVADQGADLDCDGFITWAERNKSECVTYIIITDPNAICDQEGGMLAGEIMTDHQDAVSTVTVNAVSPVNALPVYVTNTDGKFTFHNIQPEQEYTITPIRNDDPMNGVNTLDLVRIQKHLLGKEPFESSSNFIAADANKSGGISAIDMIEIRKLILGLYTEFPDNNSWRFVREGAVVGQGQTWSIEEEVTVFPLQGENITNLDFIGIKVGDVNNTAKANLLQVKPRNNRDVMIVNGAWLNESNASVAELKLIIPKNISGFQWTLELDGLEFTGVRSRELPIDENNVGVLGNGVVTMSWNGDIQNEEGDDDVAIILTFNRTGKTDLKSAVKMTSKVTQAEAYDVTEEIKDVKLEFPENGHSSDFALYQNLPNPWKDQTLIPFDLPEDATAVLTIYDAAGKVLHQVKGDFKAGSNTIMVKTSEILASGLLYYQLEANGLSATRKMLLIE